MGLTLETSVSAITVFIQGLLSFFSPCILPLIPLYMSYLAGGMKSVDEEGNISYPKKEVMLHTIFFVIGISFAFIVLGFGFSAIGQFFSSNRLMLARISGIIMIFFGLYQGGFLGHSMLIEKEHRMQFNVKGSKMNPFSAFLLGFTFSFAWTPCVGPTLGSVLLMATSSGSSNVGFMLIAVFTLGFVLPFLAVGLFTTEVLNFFKKNQQIVQYTVKIGAILLIFMGIMTSTGFMNGVTNYLSTFDNLESSISKQSQQENDDFDEDEDLDVQSEDVLDEDVLDEDILDEDVQAENISDLLPALDFELYDQFGNSHSLNDYKGKTIFLNFWATWCPPCRLEMPDIQSLYEDYGLNEEDVIVLGVSAPNMGQEGSISYISEFLEENDYTFPVLMDTTYSLFNGYAIMAFPTTFMIDGNGDVFGYIASMLSKDIMVDIVEQTLNSQG